MKVYRAVIPLFCAIFTNSAEALTYYVDASCTNHAGFVNDIITDAIAMGANAARRNRLQGADANMQWVFKNLFHVDQDSTQTFPQPQGFPPANAAAQPGQVMTAYDKVNCIFDTVGGLVPNPNNDRDTANLRIYCDDDPFDRTANSAARWQLVPNRPNDPQPNSGRTVGVDAEVFDQVNWMRRAPSTQGCQDAETKAETFAEVETDVGALNYNNNPAPANLAQQRTTITICDYALNDPNGYFPNKAFTPQYIPLNTALNEISLASNAYNFIVSAIFLHELTHINPLCTDDAKGGKLRGGSYGWTNCMHMSAAQAVGQIFPPGQGEDTFGNAENYMFFAILARCADRGYKLSTSPVSATKGILLADANLPPKMVRRRRIEWAKLHAREFWHGFGSSFAQSPAEHIS